MKFKDIINYENWKNLDGIELGNKDLKDFILQKLVRKPYRKQKILDEGKNDILYALSKKLEKNEPINIVLLFGGYKHFWNDANPSIDWAELFFIDHIINWLKPILSVYKPGVIFTFASEDIILDVMNGYTQKELDFYYETFLNLLDSIKRFFPENFKIEYVRMGKDIYDGNKVKKEVLEGVEQKIIDFKKNDIEEQKKYLYRCARNIKKENISFEDEIRSKMIEDLFYEIEEKYSGDFFLGDKIYITLTWGRSKKENIYNWLSIGSTRSTLVDFWIGKGIIEKQDGKIIKKIISQTQYEKIKNNISVENVDGNILDLDIFNMITILGKGKIC